MLEFFTALAVLTALLLAMRAKPAPVRVAARARARR